MSSYVSTAVSLGFIAGPALGGLISSYGLQYPAYISSILLTIDVLFISLLLPNITPSPKSAAVVASSDTPSESAASAVKRSLSRLEAAKAYLGKISQFGHGVMLVYILHFLACLVRPTTARHHCLFGRLAHHRVCALVVILLDRLTL